MEKFVDRIIETDRRAREIIEQAQAEKQNTLAQARARAEEDLARRKADTEAGCRRIDEEFAQREAADAAAADAAYLDAKHALDASFASSHDEWLRTAVRNILGAE